MFMMKYLKKIIEAISEEKAKEQLEIYFKQQGFNKIKIDVCYETDGLAMI